MKKICLGVAFIMALGQIVSVSADAATATSTLNVSATVGAICTVSTTAVEFGSYEGATVYSTGDVTVTCPSGLPYNIALDNGLNGSYYRAMINGNGVDLLSYQLYKDNSHSTEWTDSDTAAPTSPFGSSLADTGNGAAQPHTVYGELPGGQTGVATGPYTDVVQVTVYY